MDGLSLKARKSAQTKKQIFLPLEHQVLRELRKAEVTKRPMVLAISGGRDSMALLNLFARLKPFLSGKLVVVHVHHGATADKSQLQFRDQAKKVVEQECRRLKIKFVTKRAKRLRASEAAFREFRYRALETVRAGLTGDALIVTAHHGDDLVETQLLRLIRGTGLSGLVGIEYLNETRLRPLLSFSRAEISKYVELREILFIDDPSNESDEPLRNWLRQNWLQPLELKSVGATKALARSLQTIAEAGRVQPPPSSVQKLRKHDRALALPRQKFIVLTDSEKKRVIGQYIRDLGVFNYTQGQIEEVIRRLDNRRVEFKFSLLKHEWRVNAEQIRAAKFNS